MITCTYELCAVIIPCVLSMFLIDFICEKIYMEKERYQNIEKLMNFNL